MHLKPHHTMNPQEPVESIDCHHYHPGGHAYLTVPRVTLSEAIAMAFVPRVAREGDNCSPPMTLRHAGEVLAMLGSDDAEVYHVAFRGSQDDHDDARVNGRETTLVHKVTL